MPFSSSAAGFLIRRRVFISLSPSLSSSSLSSPWWRRSLSTQTRSVIPNPSSEREKEVQLQPQLQRPPWLLLSSLSTPESRYLYDIIHSCDQDEDQQQQQAGLIFNRKLHLPQIPAKEMFVGSSEGFLFSVDHSSSYPPNIRATNPLTGAHLSIPPVTCNDKGGLVADYGTKVALSPCLNTLLLLDSDGHLLYAQLAAPNSYTYTSWTRVPIGCGWQDFIFHKGLLYTIYANDYAIGLGVFDLLGGGGDLHNSYVELPVWYGPEEPDIKLTLVESPDRKDLFFVLRVKADEDDDPCIRDSTQTNYCKVYKLEVEEDTKVVINKWEEMQNIGDIAMFVGTNSSSLSLSARNFPSLKPNSVYFSDSWDYHFGPGLLPESIGDAGVCNLGNRGIEFFQLTDGLRHLNWPRPVWYMPKI